MRADSATVARQSRAVQVVHTSAGGCRRYSAITNIGYIAGTYAIITLQYFSQPAAITHTLRCLLMLTPFITPLYATPPYTCAMITLTL